MKHRCNHKITLYLSLLLSIGMMGSASLHSQQQTAQKSLELLRKLPQPILKELGFTSQQMVQRSSSGEPLGAQIVTLGSIKAFNAGDDPGKLLLDSNELHYPVYVDKRPISSITIRKKGGGWEFALFGDRGILLAEKARLRQPVSRPSYFMVQVQALYLTFLAYYQAGKLYLIPTCAEPDLKYPLYEPVPAERVFLALKCLLDRLPPTVSLSVEKMPLQPGETTILTVMVKGLSRDMCPITLHLQNMTPGIVEMHGGNHQTHLIHAEDILADGTFILTRTLMGKIPGTFNISANLDEH